MPSWFWAVLAFLLGGCIASFLGVVGERVPRHETLGGRSHCVCGKPLSGAVNIPIVGWLVCRGRARCCGATIPARYVLTELGLSVGWAVTALVAPNLVVALIVMTAMAGLALWASWHRPEPGELSGAESSADAPSAGADAGGGPGTFADE